MKINFTRLDFGRAVFAFVTGKLRACYKNQPSSYAKKSMQISAFRDLKQVKQVKQVTLSVWLMTPKMSMGTFFHSKGENVGKLL